MAKEKRSFLQVVANLPANFWYACFMEILERLAFFGVRAIAPLFLVASAGDNGLGLSYKEKGIIYTVWALLQCLIPMVSGGYTDRYGYRKSLAVAFTINIIGYIGMANSKPLADYFMQQGWQSGGFWVFMVAACLIGTGTAIFKPPAHGTIAKSTDEGSSSLGWGIFYWTVNIGGALAPMGAAVLRVEIDWHRVFYAAAIVTACNFLPAFLLYKEPKKDPEDLKKQEGKGILATFFSSIATIFGDLRLVVFLGIFSCFWLMFMQLWDLLPNFIDEWVDSADVAPVFGWFREDWVLGSGQVKPEMIVNIDAIAIILLVIPISWIIGKIHKVAAMIIGMVISLVAFVASGSTMIGWFCCLAVFVFSIGEMACSPTFSAYVGLIAPRDKKALYMGYSNIPFAIGWALGNLLGGYVYDDCGAKANLAFKELASESRLVARAAQSVDWSDTLEKIPELLGIDRDEAFDKARQEMGTGAEAAADTLLSTFKYDQGQIENLCLKHLALHPENQEKVLTGLAKSIAEWPGEATLEQVGVAKYVHEIPAALGIQRSVAFAQVRDWAHKDVPPAERKGDTEIADMLWETYGRNSDVLNNLALEYLAQATTLVHDAVSTMEFKAAPDDLEKRLEEVEERIGISAEKAFAALSTAVVVDDSKIEEALQAIGADAQQPQDRLYLCLISDPKHRLDAIARKDWKKDAALLREIVRSDPQVLEIVLDEIDEESWFDGLVAWFKGLFPSDEYQGEVTEEGVNYYRLAPKKDLIQKALAVKDWAQVPQQAAGVLGLNPFEARALILADEKQATRLLWDRYNPFVVWYYLGGMGLLGTIGMILFYLMTPKSLAAEAEESGKQA